MVHAKNAFPTVSYEEISFRILSGWISCTLTRIVSNLQMQSCQKPSKIYVQTYRILCGMCELHKGISFTQSTCTSVIATLRPNLSRQDVPKPVGMSCLDCILILQEERNGRTLCIAYSAQAVASCRTQPWAITGAL